MEQQFAASQDALAELQAALVEKDAALAAYERDAAAMREHSTVGWERQLSEAHPRKCSCLWLGPALRGSLA